MKNIKVKASLFEIQAVYEWLRANFANTTLHPEVALMIYHNINLLSKPYEQILKGLYNENNDPQFKEYTDKMRALYMQYVDRDEQAKPKLDERGNPMITEMTVEFAEARAKLDKEYDELNKKLLKKNEANFNYLNQLVDIEIVTIPWERLSEIGTGLPPLMIGFISKEPITEKK